MNLRDLESSPGDHEDYLVAINRLETRCLPMSLEEGITRLGLDVDLDQLVAGRLSVPS
jgi:hypothetical protein